MRLAPIAAVATAVAFLFASFPVEAQDRARTRITIQKRSYLDAGTTIKPGSGDRRYHDYAFPPDKEYPSYGPYAAGSGSYGASRGPLLRIFEAPGF